MAKLHRGQALVEFALVTPLFLFIFLGAVAVGMLMLNRLQLQHAANETAVAVAQHPSGCSVASARSAQILGGAPDTVACSSTGQIVTVTLTHEFAAIAPVVPSRVVTTARAIIRHDAEASPSP